MKPFLKDYGTLTLVWIAVSFGLVLGGGLAWTLLVLLWGWM